MLPRPTTNTLTGAIVTPLFSPSLAGGARPPRDGSPVGGNGLIEEVRLDVIEVELGEGLRRFVVGCVSLDLRMIERVGAGDQHVGTDVLRLHRLRDLLELINLVEEQLPSLHVVVPPASALGHVAAEHVRLLKARSRAELRPKIAGERRELLEDRLDRCARVLISEFEAHRPAAQIFFEEGLLVRIIEIRGAHYERVGEQWGLLNAEPIFEFKAFADPFRPQTLP